MKLKKRTLSSKSSWQKIAVDTIQQLVVTEQALKREVATRQQAEANEAALWGELETTRWLLTLEKQKSATATEWERKTLAWKEAYKTSLELYKGIPIKALNACVQRAGEDENGVDAVYMEAWNWLAPYFPSPLPIPPYPPLKPFTDE